MKRLVIQKGKHRKEVSVCENQKFIETVEYLMNFRGYKNEIQTILDIVKSLCKLKDIYYGQE